MVVITAEMLRDLLHYDPETGMFTWRRSKPLPQGGWHYQAGKVAGGITHGYRRIVIDGKRYYAHRLAWLYMTDEWPAALIDHANRDGTDNRWANLRAANKRLNAANAKIRSDNSSGLKGVSYDRASGRWRAQLFWGSEKYTKGFDTAAEAHAAYVAKAKELFGEFARMS